MTASTDVERNPLLTSSSREIGRYSGQNSEAHIGENIKATKRSFFVEDYKHIEPICFATECQLRIICPFLGADFWRR
jgi:hypothetical protein